MIKRRGVADRPSRVVGTPSTHNRFVSQKSANIKSAQRAWEPGGGEKYDISVRLDFFGIPILKKVPKYLQLLPVRARLATARARQVFSEFPVIRFSYLPYFQISDLRIVQQRKN